LPRRAARSPMCWSCIAAGPPPVPDIRDLRRAEEQARHRHQGAEQIRLEMVPAGTKWWLARNACAVLTALQSPS